MVAQKMLLGLSAVAAATAASSNVKLPFVDHFDKGLDQWSVHGNGTWDSHYDLLEGRLVDNSTWITVTPNSNDYTISTIATSIDYPGTQNGIIIRAADSDKGNFYMVSLHVYDLNLSLWKDGQEKVIQQKRQVFRTGHEQELKVVVAGENFKVYLNGDDEPLIDANDKTYTEGGVGFCVEGEAVLPAFYRTISITNGEEAIEL